MYHPTDNYERNFLLVKKFGTKPFMLIIPLLMILRIICIAYLSLTKNEMMEITLIKLLFSKINPEISLQSIESSLMMISSVVSLFFITVFLLFFMTSNDPSREAVPNTSLSMAYKWSAAQIVLRAAAFVGMLLFTVLFTVKGPEYFEEVGKLFNVTLQQMEAYKVTIILTALMICVILAMLIWYSQSQAEFVKSIRLTLQNSVARNKGAHTFGVFSMSLSIAQFCFAGIMTFIYYCYKDALNGFGISMEQTYVYVSLAFAYIRGLIPFCVAVCALTYSEMVDEANTVGTIYYSNVETLGEVQDPNLNRRKL